MTLVGLITADGDRGRGDPAGGLVPGTILLLEGNDAALGALFGRLPLARVRSQHEVPVHQPSEELRSIEAVVGSQSPLIGRTVEGLGLQSLFRPKLSAISRRGSSVTQRLREVQLRAGDLLVLQAGERALSGTMRDLGLLPLAERIVTIGDRRQRYGPVLILAAAIGLVMAQVLTISGARVMLTLSNSCEMRTPPCTKLKEWAK